MFDKGGEKQVTVGQQQLFEVAGVGERPTVGQDAGSVNQRIAARAVFDPFTGSHLPDRIKLLEGQAEWVDRAMAGSAVRILRVGGDLLTNRRLHRVGRIRGDRIDVGRRGWGCSAKDGFTQPHAPMHRPLPRTIGGEAEHGGGGEDATARTPSRKRDAGEGWRRGLGQTVKLAQPRVGHRPVGVEEGVDRGIGGKHLAKIVEYLLPHARLQPGVVGGIESEVRGKHAQPMQL